MSHNLEKKKILLAPSSASLSNFESAETKCKERLRSSETMRLGTLLWSTLRQYGDHSENGYETIAPRGTGAADINPLTSLHRRGLIGVSITSLLSGIATAVSLVFITYRLIFWQKYFKSYIGYNQFIILIYNLLIADTLQAAGFLISFHWLRINALKSEPTICYVQGWLLQIADPSSGLFVLAIAVHTFVTVLLGRKVSYRVFVSCVIGLWMFCLLLGILPSALYGQHAFAVSGPWVSFPRPHDLLSSTNHRHPTLIVLDR